MIILSSQVESIASRKDKTIKLTLATQELSPKDAANLFQLNQQFCYLAIKEEPFSKEEQDIVENLKADPDTFKTPSQRLRGILTHITYPLWIGYVSTIKQK
jgi:hypothetical protein